MTDSSPRRYRAFISYSQRDQQHAKRLHSALESYRVPGGIEVPLGPNRRLGRFFRDSDEMGASTDLGATLRGALEDSDNLIVICSPHAARSKWVNAEVVHFQSLGLGDRIFAAIVDGVPNSGDPESECFPPALRFESSGDELLSEKRGAEPLGVDVRKERFARARLRLAAGLMGISFDSLWQREKRRAAKRRALGGVATLVLASVIVVLSAQWLAARGRVRAQTIERDLVSIRNDLASERANDALARLDGLYSPGAPAVVSDAVTGALSWVSTPTELMAEIERPALVANGSRLSLLATNGSRHPVSILGASRFILTSDRRQLLIVGADQAVMLDTSDGRELARTSATQTDWTGRAFETGGGMLVVVGQNVYGVSNGTRAVALLVYAPRRRTLSVVHKDDSINRWAISADCRTLGLFTDREPTFGATSLARDPGGMTFFSAADADSLQPVSPPASLAGWKSMSIWYDEGQDDASGDAISEMKGCVAPAADSEHPTEQTRAALPVRPIGLGSFWESARRWSAAGKARAEAVTADGERRAWTGPGRPPCSEERPCRVQDPEFGATFGGFDFAQPGWTAVAPPRGVHRDDRSFDRIDQQVVHAYRDAANAGLISAWCRNLKSTPACLEIRTALDFGDVGIETDVRSTTGRFLLDGRGGVRGFQLLDLQTMRNVTPAGSELLASTKRADFGPRDERLFVAMDGQLHVFAPPPDSGRWRPARSAASVQIPALSGSAGDEIAGLFALEDSNLIVVRGSGVVTRFDWRTGQESWGRKIGGIGVVEGAVVSRNRRYLLIVGASGGRLLETTDGLVLSGVLVAPPAMEGRRTVRECFRDAFVSDEGVVEVSCGENAYRRERRAFQGDAGARLREILSDEVLVAEK